MRCALDAAPPPPCNYRVLVPAPLYAGTALQLDPQGRPHVFSEGNGLLRHRTYLAEYGDWETPAEGGFPNVQLLGVAIDGAGWTHVLVRGELPGQTAITLHHQPLADKTQTWRSGETFYDGVGATAALAATKDGVLVVRLDGGVLRYVRLARSNDSKLFTVVGAPQTLPVSGAKGAPLAATDGDGMAVVWGDGDRLALTTGALGATLSEPPLSYEGSPASNPVVALAVRRVGAKVHLLVEDGAAATARVLHAAVDASLATPANYTEVLLPGYGPGVALAVGESGAAYVVHAAGGTPEPQIDIRRAGGNGWTVVKSYVHPQRTLAVRHAVSRATQVHVLYEATGPASLRELWLTCATLTP